MKPIVPKEATLKKYGLTAEEWAKIAEEQGNVCAVCGNLPKSRRLNTDHEHVKNYKKLPPEERKRFVRGLACYWCNYHLLARGISIAKLIGATNYLTDYIDRRENAQR